MLRYPLPRIAVILALAAVYYGSARLGLALAVDAQHVTAIWPPTGIALAAVLLLGSQVWPGIAIGAFAVNFGMGEPAATAMGIATGNTLEALVAAWLLRHVARFDPRLQRVRDVIALVLCSAVFSTMIAATIGVTSLCLGGVQPWARFHDLWMLWWIGDAGGAMLAAPILLVWSTSRLRLTTPLQQAEAAALIASFLYASLAVFSTPPGGFTYPLFPFVVWAALRFGLHGATFVTFTASVLAIWGTMNGMGPFSRVPLEQGMVRLQTFMPVLGITGLLLAAALTERAAAMAALKDADRRKNEFLATLAHELRNPLAPLANALSIARHPGTDAPRRDEALQIIARQTRHLVQLVDDLLDMARLSHGKIDLRKERVQLAEIIRGAVETVDPAMRAHRHSLSVEMPEEPIWLEADAMRISQIFSNLLSNAAKYTPERGQIRLMARAEPGNVSIAVRDNGIGIPAPMTGKIFNMFAQGSSSMEGGGLGIGLTLVKRLVEMHGGSISVSSEGDGKGSEFTVRLPRIQPPANIAKPAPAAVAKAAPGLRVLVADDNEAITQTLGWMLEAMGHEVQVASDGNQAVDRARSFVPDVLLRDIGLPGMNGYDACQQLRAEPALADSLFIAQTGWDQPQHRRRSQEAGFHHHLVKPVDARQLETLLSKVRKKEAA